MTRSTGKKGGRPAKHAWPERVCRHCGRSYRNKDTLYCSEVCRVVALRTPLPSIAPYVKAFLAKGFTYDRIAEAVGLVIGKPISRSMVARVVALMRALEEAGLPLGFQAEARDEEDCRPCRGAGRPKPAAAADWPKETRGGVTLYGVSLPAVTKAEVRLGATAWHGFERGLQPAPEPEKKKRGRKKKAPSALVQQMGPEV